MGANQNGAGLKCRREAAQYVRHGRTDGLRAASADLRDELGAVGGPRSSPLPAVDEAGNLW